MHVQWHVNTHRLRAAVLVPSLNAGNGVVGETPRNQESDVRTVADNSPGNEFELSNSAPDVGNDISSCIEHAKVIYKLITM